MIWPCFECPRCIMFPSRCRSMVCSLAARRRSAPSASLDDARLDTSVALPAYCGQVRKSVRRFPRRKNVPSRAISIVRLNRWARSGTSVPSLGRLPLHGLGRGTHWGNPSWAPHVITLQVPNMRGKGDVASWDIPRRSIGFTGVLPVEPEDTVTTTAMKNAIAESRQVARCNF